MRRFKTFVVNTLILTISSLILNIVGICFNVYISNKVGEEALGVYQLIQSIYVFAITLATSGIAISITHIVSKKIALKEYEKIKQITKQAVILGFTIGTIAMCILILFSSILTNKFLHSRISSKSLIILALSLPPLAVSACINGYFSAVTRVIKSAIATFIEQFFKIILSVYFFSIILPNNVENACISLVLGSLLSEFISFIYLLLLYKNDKKRYKGDDKEKKNYIKDIAKISFPIAITSYIRSGMSTLKQVIIPIRLEKSGMSCKLALSQYGMITGMVMQLIWFPCLFVNVFAGLLIPEYSRLNALSNTNRIKDVTQKIFKLTMIFSVCIFGIFYTFADSLSMAIFNRMEISKYIKMISPLVLIMYLDNVVDGMLKGLNKQVSVMICNIVDLFVSTILMYILLPIYGIYGYVITLFVSEILNGIISIVQLLITTKFKLNITEILLKPLFCVIITIWSVHFLMKPYNGKISSLAFQILIYISCYVFMIFVSSTLTKSDLRK